MKIYRELEQGSQEWLDLRVGKITGSILKGVLQRDTTTLMQTLLAEKLSGRAQDFFSSAAMQRGTETEPLARRSYEDKTGRKVEEVGFIQNGRFSFVGFSPDGIISDPDKKYRRAVEIKCPETKTHVKYILNNSIPDEYDSQVLSYFYNMPDLQYLDFVSYDNRAVQKPIHIITVQRHMYEDQISRLNAELPRFWARLTIEYNKLIF